MPLKILALADNVSPALYDYFQPERWKDVDLILSCGDLPPGYLDFVCTELGVPLVYVRGNHDSGYSPSEYDGCLNAHGRILTVAGVKIAGFEGSQRYNGRPHQFSETEMRHIVLRSRFRALVHGTPQIVLTHAPPAGIHDGTDVCHRGFQCFRDLIDAWRPSFFVHGHVHTHYGREMSTSVGETTIVNAFPFQTFQIESAQPDTSRRVTLRRPGHMSGTLGTASKIE